jgi:hypothetical protein
MKKQSKEDYRISKIWNKLVANSTIGDIDDIIFPFYKKAKKEGINKVLKIIDKIYDMVECDDPNWNKALRVFERTLLEEINTESEDKTK